MAKYAIVIGPWYNSKFARDCNGRKITFNSRRKAEEYLLHNKHLGKDMRIVTGHTTCETEWY
jgi:hypothetical protein